MVKRIDKPLSKDERYEIDKLVKDFREVCKFLEQEVGHLQISNKDLLTMVTQLESANKKLEQVDHLKSSFVANVSHEFRTPLTIVRTSLENINDGIKKGSPEEQGRMIKLGLDSIDRLVRMVNEVLDLAQIESGKIGMERELMDVQALVEEVLFGFEEFYKKKKVVLERNLGAGLPNVWGDRDKITQVITNLLDNALKFTPAESKVIFSVVCSDGDVRFEVVDEGEGVPESERERIFDKFEQVKKSKKKGAGLGLAISKSIVVMHGGKIWVEDRPDGNQGSKFVFKIPADLRKQER